MEDCHVLFLVILPRDGGTVLPVCALVDLIWDELDDDTGAGR